MIQAWSPEQALLWSHSGQWTACDPWSLKSSRSVQYFGLTQPINSTTAVGEHHHGPSEQPVADDLADPTQAASIRRRSSVVVDLQQHLANDIGTVMRRRAELGYGMGVCLPKLHCTSLLLRAIITHLVSGLLTIRDFFSPNPLSYDGKIALNIPTVHCWNVTERMVAQSLFERWANYGIF